MGEGKSKRNDGDASRRTGPPTRRHIPTAAEKEEELRQKYRKRARDKRWAAGLVSLGAVVGVQHWLRHLGAIDVPMNLGLQDLVIGYPVAGLLILVGLMKLPA